MLRDIAKYVWSCTSCQKYKTEQRAKSGKMLPSVNTTPWATVCSVIVRPLPTSSQGNSYLLVLFCKQDFYLRIQSDVYFICKLSAIISVNKFRRQQCHTSEITAGISRAPFPHHGTRHSDAATTASDSRRAETHPTRHGLEPIAGPSLRQFPTNSIPSISDKGALSPFVSVPKILLPPGGVCTSHPAST